MNRFLWFIIIILLLLTGCFFRKKEAKPTLYRTNEPTSTAVGTELVIPANLVSTIDLSHSKQDVLDYLSDIKDKAIITDIILNNTEIKYLTVLSHFKSLTNLQLNNNKIRGISALAALSSLKTLTLDNNDIKDISALTTLTSLTELSLRNNPLDNISLLANLTSLTRLDLSHNHISDISALSALTGLTSLNLSYNDISDISVLAQLKHLKTLNLNGNNVKDLNALTQLTSLTELYISTNHIADIPDLSRLNLLSTLDLFDNFITNVSPLSKLASLKQLNLGFNIISDPSPLSILSSSIELNPDFNDNGQIHSFTRARIKIKNISSSDDYSKDGFTLYTATYPVTNERMGIVCSYIALSAKNYSLMLLPLQENFTNVETQVFDLTLNDNTDIKYKLIHIKGVKQHGMNGSAPLYYQICLKLTANAAFITNTLQYAIENESHNVEANHFEGPFIVKNSTGCWIKNRIINYDGTLDKGSQEILVDFTNMIYRVLEI